MTTSTQPKPTIDTVGAATLQSWIDTDDDLIVLDVRSGAEFETVHIRGSYNVPLPLLSEHADELAGRLGRRTVLVCQSGTRAEQARQRLNGAGVEAWGVTLLVDSRYQEGTTGNHVYESQDVHAGVQSRRGPVGGAGAPADRAGRA